MKPPPETIRVTHRRIACDGTGNGLPAALGHPRVFLEIDEHGYVDCGYCDRRFILVGGPADGADQAALPDIASGASPSGEASYFAPPRREREPEPKTSTGRGSRVRAPTS